MTDMLEQRLGQLADRLDVAVGDRLVVGVLAAIEPGRETAPAARRLRRPALVAAAAALLATGLIPGTRHAIADWLGIGGTRIEQQPSNSPVEATFPTVPPAETQPPTPSSTDTTPTPATATPATPTPTTPTPTTPTPTTALSAQAVGAALELGASLSPEAAATAAAVPVPKADGLGEPVGVFVVTPPATGQIVVVYPPGPSLPPTPVAGVGALLATSPGTVDDGSFVKLTGPDTTVTAVQVITGEGKIVNGFWLDGAPHAYGFMATDGTFEVDTLRLATNTLLWVVDGVQYRLESELQIGEALAVARSVITAR